MSELSCRAGAGLVISAVDPASPAEQSGLRTGDVLVAVNGQSIADVLDFRYRVAAGQPVLSLRRDGRQHALPLHVANGEDPGLTFEDELGGRVHTCNNRCVFCFIHQLPRHMRKSLYLMDDDFRLSFMHGNYVTLTNVSDEQWSRILRQRLSPLYVSVHATDPVLRARLLGRTEPAPVLDQLRELIRHGIDVHAQIVLCPGWNDGAALDRTLSDLAAEHPARTGLRAGVLSVAIVPVGLTRYRERLTSLSPVDAAYASEAIGAVDGLARRLRGELGSRFVWLSDEWYWLSDRPVPSRGHYETFPQLGDGVGTTRLFLDEAARLARRLPTATPRPVHGTVVTGALAAGAVRAWVERLNVVEGVSLDLCVAPNRFFGERIGVAGLLTAQDIVASVRQCGGTGPVWVPSVCLSADGIFLDEWSPADLSRACERPVEVVEPTPGGLAAALGLLRRGGRAPGARRA
ncbi:MAG TPA: DUF512 domain-containing protein [Chthonomonadales bacterium]|nr:DUF512 domain-containing protein [Chthonomonadales bacterium]